MSAEAEGPATRRRAAAAVAAALPVFALVLLWVAVERPLAAALVVCFVAAPLVLVAVTGVYGALVCLALL